jgi:hypothetical protein
MAKKTNHRKNIIRYLLFTVIALLITVSLLSLFVFKYANFASNNVVLGASTGPSVSGLFCGTCKGSIVLQKDGTDPRNWGAKCVATEKLNTIKYLAYISCPIPAQAKHTVPTQITHTVPVNTHNSK